MDKEIIENVVNTDGITLIGEAANNYITYKYVTYFTDLGVTCFWQAVVIGIIGWAVYKTIKEE